MLNSMLLQTLIVISDDGKICLVPYILAGGYNDETRAKKPAERLSHNTGVRVSELKQLGTDRLHPPEWFLHDRKNAGHE